MYIQIIFKNFVLYTSNIGPPNATVKRSTAHESSGNSIFRLHSAYAERNFRQTFLRNYVLVVFTVSIYAYHIMRTVCILRVCLPLRTLCFDAFFACCQPKWTTFLR